MRSVTMGISPFDLENCDVDWVVQRIRRELSAASFNLDFFEWADNFLLTKTAKTRGLYNSSVNSFTRFLGARKCDINSISKSMLQRYAEWVEHQPKMYYCYGRGELIPTSHQKMKGASSAIHLKRLQHIFEAAKNRYNDEDTGEVLIGRSPFSSFSKVVPVYAGQPNLGRELMQRLISYQTDDRIVRFALDVFIISFGLRGANLADLYDAGMVEGSTWVYHRMKTRNRVKTQKAVEARVDIPDELRPFIVRLQEQGSDLWLPVLHSYGGSSKNNCCGKINRGLARWCQQNGVKKFTLYAARHTWASLARSIGIEKATVDECLVHKGDYALTDIYAERAWHLHKEANRKVLCLFEWPI
ncbi:MAG: phage integrase SAM-like domain-containing protein [Parasporobacterium sp.]|nr:phage integrase SAM-like domain-containing protein [Parasporobacterium sp.]